MRKALIVTKCVLVAGLALYVAYRAGESRGLARQEPCPAALPVVHTVIKYDEAGRREAAKSLEDQGLIRMSD